MDSDEQAWAAPASGPPVGEPATYRPDEQPPSDPDASNETGFSQPEAYTPVPAWRGGAPPPPPVRRQQQPQRQPQKQPPTRTDTQRPRPSPPRRANSQRPPAATPPPRPTDKTRQRRPDSSATQAPADKDGGSAALSTRRTSTAEWPSRADGTSLESSLTSSLSTSLVWNEEPPTGRGQHADNVDPVELPPELARRVRSHLSEHHSVAAVAEICEELDVDLLTAHRTVQGYVTGQ